MRLPVVLCSLVLASLPALALPGEALPLGGRTILYQPHIPRCGSEMTVAWESVPDATGYDLQVSTSGPWTNWKTHVKGTSAVYTVKPGETPWFRIRALGARHVSGWERSVTPTAGGGVVEITSPEPGLHARRDTKILLTANAPEDACGIREIAWKLDGKEIARAAKPPYRHVLTCPVLGRHQIVASATMTDGSTRDSAPLPFRVTRYPNEGCENVDSIAVYPGMVETPAKARPNRYHKPVKPAGTGQKLETWYAWGDIDAPLGFYIDQPYEIVTNDGFPPNHLRLSLLLAGYVGSDEEMRRARIYHLETKTKAWQMLKGATLDEETMTLSAPITKQGIYCLSAPPEEPKAPDVWWLSPAEGETVSGKTRLLVAGRGLSKGSYAVEFCIERLEVEPLTMLVEGTPPSYGELGGSMRLDRLSVEEIATALLPERTAPETEDQFSSQDLLVDFSAFTPGRYRLVATSSPSEALTTSAARTITVASNVKAPTVTVDAKPIRTSDPPMGYALTGTLNPGTLGEAPRSAGVSLFYRGVLIGGGQYDPRPGRWRAALEPGIFGTGPADVTVYAFDALMNRSKPVRWTGTVPLSVRLYPGSDEPVPVGRGARLMAWAEGGAVRNGTRCLFEASRDNGKTWTTVRAAASSPDCTWKPTRAGKYKIRVTATNGRERAVQTVAVTVKG